ncbi:MAG: hypothetical protein HYS41_05675 [Candidatus Omnitrophica bacterium]|nr:hypothetical protein [Candidatus Omnitrophota bacterium]
MNWIVQAATDSVRAIFTRVGNFIPTLLGVLIILVVGWLVAGWLQRLLVGALKAIRLDDLAHTARISDILKKGEVKYSLSELLGIFLYWLVILATLLAGLNALGLTMAAELLEKVLAFVPSVLAGVIVLVLGLFFGTLVSGIVQTAAANAGISQAKGLGQISRVVVILFAVAIALEKFFSSIIIQTTFTVVLAAVAFGFSLAFGLGCKEIAGRAVGDFLDKLRGR